MKKRILTPADYKRSMGMKLPCSKQIIKSIKYKVEKNDTLQVIADKFYVTTDEIKILNNLTTNTVKENDVLIIPYRQKWTSTMIRKIVTDETQIGTLVQGKTEKLNYKSKYTVMRPKDEWIKVPHCHEPNMDIDTFNAMCDMFKPTTRNRVQRNGEPPLFSKKVYCECCKKAFYKNSVKYKGENKDYLQCGSKKLGKNQQICSNSEAVKLAEFQSYILEKINKKINDYFNLSKVNKQYYLENVYSNIETTIESLEKEKNKIKADIDNKSEILVQLYADKVKGELSSQEFTIIKNSNSIEVERLKTRLLEIEDEIIKLDTNRKKELDKEQLFGKYKNADILDKTLLDAFISKIRIGKTDIGTKKRQIKIEWNL